MEHPKRSIDLGRIGIWSPALRNAEPAVAVNAAAELDELGYGALWFPGGPREGFAERMSALLDATTRAVIATGIVSIWTHPADRIAAEHHAFQQAHPGRFLLGIGISHKPAVERSGHTYERPLSKLRSYLDELDQASPPVPVNERILASLGPRSLQLARERSLGTHPYFMPVSHTLRAREALGPDRIVASELMVALQTDPEVARTVARQHMATYLNAPNYTTNLLRLGYTEADIREGGSDRLVDDIVAWGDEEQIMARVAEHHAAGADHVCLQVLENDRNAPGTRLGENLLAR